MSTSTSKTFLPNSKDIKYLNKDFSQLKQALVNFAKTYYPNTYKDFTPASPGMMFMEQAAYIGDVLNYYIDYAFNEGLFQNATERKNIISFANYLGYIPKVSRASTGTLNLYQLCPSTSDGNGGYIPDPNYMLVVNENSQFSNTQGSYYLLNQLVDFNVSTSLSPRTDTVYSRNPDGTPQFFQLQKQGIISAGQILTKQVVVNSPVPYFSVYLDESNVLDIINVIDSDNNQWYQVDYLAQELVATSIPNDSTYEGPLTQYQDSVPYILDYLRTSRRFVVRVDENNLSYLQFGSGTNGIDDEIVTFNPNLIGSGLSNINNVNVPLDPSNFLMGENYGISPANTTLTITYVIGGGISSNCQSQDVTTVVSANFSNTMEGLTPEQATLLTTVETSLIVSNPEACTGGDDAETNDEIKLNAISYFAAQNRAVTQQDYLVRVYSLPAQFGSIAKAQIVTDSSLEVGINKILTGTIDTNNVANVTDNGINNYFRNIAYDISNPFSINVYILSYDQNKNLIAPNQALITNLITYISQFRMLSDGINVIDGYVINIGVNFTISVYKGYNKKDVLVNAITAVQNFFDIDQWNFSQPINTSQLQLEIAKVDGVQAVVNLDIVNKTTVDGDYSPVQYDIQAATKNGIIYPSVDPSIFECKYSSDIVGSTS